MIFSKQIVQAYEATAYARCDDTKTVFYFSNEDFEGLKKESYPFPSSLGHTLQGYLYSYDNPKANILVVFDHGFGGGHTAYTKEIEMLCKKGYTVLAYDHTGCMESGGTNTNGMAQSLHDLDDCFTFIKQDERFNGYDFYAMGHSWGGFSTINIASIHKEIKKVCVMCGFVCVEKLIESNFSGLLKGYRKDIMALEEKANPVYVKYNAIESLKKTNAKTLLIYSINDHLCKKAYSYDLLYSALQNQDNIEFILVDNKDHNPNYTEKAVILLNQYVNERTKLLKKNKLQNEEEIAAFLSKYDFDKMTEQDESIWQRIFDHFEN